MKKQNRVAFFNILSTVLLRGLSIFTAPLFSRLLGTDGYGVLNIYTIWVSVAAIAMTFQTQGTLINARIEYAPEEQDKYQSSVMCLSLLFFLTCSAAVLVFLEPLSKLLNLNRILVILILVQSFGTFCVNFLNTKFTYEFKAGRNFAVSMGVALTTLVLSVILILLMPEDVNYYGRILALAVTYGGLGIAVCAATLLRGKTFYQRKYWKFCLYLSIPLMFYNLSDLVLGQSDRVMLQRMLGDAAVGQYSLALNFGGIMFTIFGALNNTWCPFFFEDIKNGRREQMHAQARNYLELYTVLSVGFILLTTEVYHLFASREFWDGTVLIPVFVTSYFMNFLCTFPVNYEYYHKKTKAVAAVTIITSAVNIVLNFFLIRSIGILGAAVATAISHCLQFALHFGYCKYILGKGDYPFGVRIWIGYLLAYLAAMAAVYLTQGMWILRWVLGAGIGIWELRRIVKRKVLI